MGQIRTIQTSQGQTLWVYEFSGGETLVSIANTYLIPAVTADIVAAYNGLDAMQASPIFAFPAGESVAVPIEWVLPNAPRSGLTVPVSGGRVGAGAAQANTGLSPMEWALVAGALALIVVASK